jgi:hypothetical protein
MRMQTEIQTTTFFYQSHIRLRTHKCLIPTLQAIAHGDVFVEYWRLDRGTFVSFTPASTTFQAALSDRGVDLEALLQDTLMRHTALSVGDWLHVSIPPNLGALQDAHGDAHGNLGATLDSARNGGGEGTVEWLQVAALRPANEVSLMDTDMEAEVWPIHIL